MPNESDIIGYTYSHLIFQWKSESFGDGKVVVSKMSMVFYDESLKNIGLTVDEAMKNWSDRYYTLELDEELKKMFP